MVVHNAIQYCFRHITYIPRLCAGYEGHRWKVAPVRWEGDRMAENLHEEGIVPNRSAEFEADGFAVGIATQDVESETPQMGKVLEVVLSHGLRPRQKTPSIQR